MDYEVNIILLVCCVYIAIIAVRSVLRHFADTGSGYVVQRRWSWIMATFWAAVTVTCTSGAVFFLRTVTTRWAPRTLHVPEQRATAPAPVFSASRQRWWEAPELCDLAVTMANSGNAEALHAVLTVQLAAVKLACAPPLVYNANGVNEPCLNAYMDLRTAVDTEVKSMVRRYHGAYEDTLP